MSKLTDSAIEENHKLLCS